MDNPLPKTTAAEMRATTQLLMQPYANWEEYVAPAPLSIAIMGELVFISSGKDFSINSPKHGYRLIKHPESFRACLMQVCNASWHAFSTAHTNMNGIRIHTLSVSFCMTKVVRILFQEEDETVERSLPNQLENISRVADECVVLAEGVEKKYMDVINLIQELLEACVNADRFHGVELENMKKKIKENKMREEAAKQLNEMSTKRLDAMTTELEDAQEAYKKAMDSLPTGWEIIGMNIAEGLLFAITIVPTIIFAKHIGTQKNACGKPETDGQQPENPNLDDTGSVMAACSRSDQILKFAMTPLNYSKDGKVNWAELYDQKNKCVKTNWVKEQFERVAEELEKHPHSKLQESALSICKNGISICEELETYSPDQEWDEKKTKPLIEKTTTLYQEAQKFDCKSKNVSGAPAPTLKPPMMIKAQSSGDQFAGDAALENARYRIEQSREQLKQCREAYEMTLRIMENNKKELTDILVELQNCNIKEIDFNTTIEMLGKGMEAMGRVKEQWEKMVRFFQMMANIVKTSLGPTMKNFVADATKTMTLSYSAKHFTKDMLYNQAFQASNIASLVHMISGTYCEVSNKYLMDRVSSLSRLMTINKEDPKLMRERVMLQESCKEAQEGILQLVKKKKTDFEKEINTRMEKIEGALKAGLPAVPPKVKDLDRLTDQPGFSEEDVACYT